MISCCPDGPRVNVGKKDYEPVETFAAHFSDDFILTSDNTSVLEDYYAYLSTIKTTWLINQWIEEEKEDALCDLFNVWPGDVYRHIESTQWLLYGAGRIADLLMKKSLAFQLEDLRNRVRYGIKEELLNIIRLKGVGRIRSRVLFDRGFTSIDKIAKVPENELASIKQIGLKLSKSIQTQIKEKKEQTLAKI